MKYDYLIVGAGLYGSVFARQKTDEGRKCLVIDRRDHIAGNIYSKDISGIDVHINVSIQSKILGTTRLIYLMVIAVGRLIQSMLHHSSKKNILPAQ